MSAVAVNDKHAIQFSHATSLSYDLNGSAGAEQRAEEVTMENRSRRIFFPGGARNSGGEARLGQQAARPSVVSWLPAF